MRSFLRGFLPVLVVGLVVAMILGRLLFGAIHLEFGGSGVVQAILL